jgi:hypothetical protein
MPSVTNVNFLPPCIGSGSRGWWVSTKTGAWYGGSSLHQPLRLSSRPAAGSEHVAAHDGGADALDDLVENPRVGVVRAPEHPLVQAVAALPDRVLEAPVRPGDVAVERGSEQPTEQAAHAGEQTLEQAEDADQQAADDGSQTAQHAHGAIAPAA